LDREGFLIILGGTNETGGAGDQIGLNDVYRSSISFSDANAVARECGLKIPICGTGLKCWPGPGTYIGDDNMVHCGTCSQISSSSNNQSGSVAALAVFMVIFLLIAIGSSYYAYTLRNASASSNVRTTNILGLGSDDSNSLYKPLSFREGPKE